MRTLPNMSLVMWDQGQDTYDHTIEANNKAKIDFHDHTPGRGVQLTTQSIEPGAITNALIAANAVEFTALATAVQERLFSSSLAYSSVKVFPASTSDIPSSTRPALAYITFPPKNLGNLVAWEVKVGGVKVFTPQVSKSTDEVATSLSFFIPKNTGWEWKTTSGTMGSVQGLYVIL